MNLLYFYKKYFFNLKLIFFIKSLKFLKYVEQLLCHVSNEYTIEGQSLWYSQHSWNITLFCWLTFKVLIIIL